MQKSRSTRGLVRALSLPAVVATVLSVAGMWITSRPEASRPRRARAEASPVSVARALPPQSTVADDRLRYTWTPGTLLRYEFSCAQAMSLTMRADALAELAKHGAVPQGQQADARMAILADLCVRVYAAADGEAVVGYRLENPSVDFACSGQATPRKAIEEMQERLSMEVFARVTDRGEVRDLRFAPEASAKERNMMRSVLALVRVVLPEGGERAWTTREEDALGTFEGTYEMSAVDADGAIPMSVAESR